MTWFMCFAIFIMFLCFYVYNVFVFIIVCKILLKMIQKHFCKQAMINGLA